MPSSALSISYFDSSMILFCISFTFSNSFPNSVNSFSSSSVLAVKNLTWLVMMVVSNLMISDACSSGFEEASTLCG